VTERSFHSAIVKMARHYGWRIAQFRAARMQDGEWRTPVGGDGKGYPDFTLVRERVMWVECKADKGRLSPSQNEWLETLKLAGQEVYVWRPRDMDEIQGILSWHDPDQWKRLLAASDGNVAQASLVARSLARKGVPV
jgi:hypothetical protein